MLKLVPLEDKDKLKKQCKAHNIEFSDKIHAYVGENGTNVLGIFSLDSYNIEILFVAFNDDLLVAELLVRAIANYGANRNAYLVKMKGSKIKSTLLTLRFEETDKDEYIGKIPQILTGTCHCDK